MRFFVGIHQPAQAKHFDACMVSVHRLAYRRSDFEVRDWIMDSGAFSTILKHGGYPTSVREYAEQVERWARCGRLLAAVAQDFMCEQHMLARTGLTVERHQELTVERYDELVRYVSGTYVMPVLQGYAPADYVRHLAMYGDRLAHGAWVGVGSVCKRNGDPSAIEEVLLAIKATRPDLRLHGFGLKATAFTSAVIVDALHSADSMAWSFVMVEQISAEEKAA